MRFLKIIIMAGTANLNPYLSMSTSYLPGNWQIHIYECSIETFQVLSETWGQNTTLHCFAFWFLAAVWNVQLEYILQENYLIDFWQMETEAG